jgi:hypothetical protein
VKKFSVTLMIMFAAVVAFPFFAFGNDIASYDTGGIKTAINKKIEKSITGEVERNKGFGNPSLLILNYYSNIKISSIKKQDKGLLVEVEETRTYFYNDKGPETISKNLHVFKLFQENGQWVADYVKDGGKIY